MVARVRAWSRIALAAVRAAAAAHASCMNGVVDMCGGDM